MKKGLRPNQVGIVVLIIVSDHRPDEEGIKTAGEELHRLLQDFRPQT